MAIFYNGRKRFMVGKTSFELNKSLFGKWKCFIKIEKNSLSSYLIYALGDEILKYIYIECP